MSEEKEPLFPDPEENSPQKAGKETGRPTSPGQQKRRQKSVFQYITVLFAAAFVLLLFTFLMEKRQNDLLQQQNQEQIDDLQESSISATQRLQDLIAERDKLKETQQELETELAEANQQLDALPAAISRQETLLEETCRALDYFWQVNEAYVRGHYSLCRQLIQEMEHTENDQIPLKDYLPKESTTDNGRFSPYDRYQEIYNRLF